jgi:quercetin dioxygenase-like cupin family protein
MLLNESIDTNGSLLEIEVTYGPLSLKPPDHFHPMQTEKFKILSGEMTVRIEDTERIVKEGEVFTIIPNTVHSMWNHSKDKTVVNWSITPALQSERFFETMTVLSNKTDTNKMLKLLQLAITLHYFSKEFRVAQPSIWVQEIILLLLSWIGWALGYKPVHKI